MSNLSNSLLILARIQVVGQILSRALNFLIFHVLALLTLFLMLHSSRLLVARFSVPIFRTVIDLIEAGAADLGNIDIR